MVIQGETVAMALEESEVSISGNEKPSYKWEWRGAGEKGQTSCGCLWLTSTVGGVGEGPEKNGR